MTNNDVFSCDICFESFFWIQSPTFPQDRRPLIICKNGHTLCSQCAKTVEECPTCREPCLDTPIVNRSLLDIVDQRNSALETVPQIQTGEITILNEQPLAMGSYAEVLHCQWNNQEVAVKRLRVHPTGNPMKELKFETNLAMSLLHPNVVSVFGFVQMECGLYGIVMEYSKMGDLRRNLETLSSDQKVRVALCITDGLKYLHSKKVAHRDLKPENILLFGPAPIAKISDFGTSKVIQTMVTNTAMAGTIKYSPPELMERGKHYGASVDTYSLAMILYEMFSNRDPYPGMTMMQIIKCMMSKQLPEMPSTFPPSLTAVVKSGWSHDPSERPEISRFQEALKDMLAHDSLSSSASLELPHRSMTIRDQVAEIRESTQPVPLISLKWSDSCDTSDTLYERGEMIRGLRERSNMKTMITESIIKAFEVVPRHLFVESSKYSGLSNSALMDLVYTYNKAMNATPYSNESSPEIIGAQLSLVKLRPGADVLLVGGKGGYIASVVAQIAGVSGRVTNISTKPEILNICQKRVNDHSPLASVMKWRVLASVTDPTVILEYFMDMKQTFHSIIYCGAISVLPEELGPLLYPGGSLLGPVVVGPNAQQFQLMTKGTLTTHGDIRKITDFGVVFEKAQ